MLLHIWTSRLEQWNRSEWMRVQQVSSLKGKIGRIRLLMFSQRSRVELPTQDSFSHPGGMLRVAMTGTVTYLRSRFFTLGSPQRDYSETHTRARDGFSPFIVSPRSMLFILNLCT